MKVAILTMFNGLGSTYSLVNVVADHLQMLLDAGLEVKMLVSEDCPDSDRWGVFKDERIEWVKVCNRYNGKQIEWHDYSEGTGNLHKTFNAEAEVIANDFVEKLADVDVCMMHDILYQGWHLIHNAAIRKAQPLLNNVKFLSFTHSMPASRPAVLKKPFDLRYIGMPKTRFIFPTYSGLAALAAQYDIPEGRCSAVYNTLPLIESMSEPTKHLHKSVNLLSPEILIVYPGRLTTGKKFEKVAALAGTLKSISNKSVKIIFCEFPSMDIKSDDYKKIITTEGENYGLLKSDIVFTSDLGYINGFPRESVLELFTLSNLFICPSYAESFGLTVLEAASRGNILVLNQAVPALEELGNKLNAHFMRWDARNFGFNTTEQYHPSEKAYYEENGDIILKKMAQDSSINSKTLVRTKYNTDWIYKNQIAPLIEND